MRNGGKVGVGATKPRNHKLIEKMLCYASLVPLCHSRDEMPSELYGVFVSRSDSDRVACGRATDRQRHCRSCFH